MVNALLFRPPFQDPERLVWMSNHDTSGLSGQTTRVVLNVTETKIDIAALRTQFQKWPIEGLEEVLAVTDTSIERIWP